MSLLIAPDAPLKDVEWRVDGRPSGAKARFVPYLNAPTVARLLDLWVGPENWRDEYEPAPGKGLWCHLSVRVKDVINTATGSSVSDWVTKTDIGVPSNFEGEKGQVSDAFKRAACLKWGVGRNVYDLPTLWAPCRVDPKGNAWPNDETLPHIQKQLKALGFEAAGGTVAAYHDEPDENEGGGAVDREAAGASPVRETTPALASFDQHDWLRKEMKNLSAEDAKKVKDWWAQHSLPSIKDKDALTLGQLELVASYLVELAEEREREVPVDNDARRLAERAAAMAAKKAAPKGPADRAAGDAA